MYKFFSFKRDGDYFILDDETQKHIRVLRIKNEPFLVNYENEFYECFYNFPNLAKINKKLNINNEYGYEIVVAIPLIKQNHFEIALQKSVELGATKIIPFISEYCDKSNLNVENKYDRFNKIIKEAAQQSFRNIIPELSLVHSFDQILDYQIDQKIMAYEKEETETNHNFKGNIMFIVGPEGGLTLSEVKKSEDKGVKIVGLTKTILRAETALIYLLCKLSNF
ncbi:16S rRNA (uracil(1498)-N(3))-methyltransferase [Metamycoplasma spumans]|uniref:16S rRNA (uracil(1498)-N(3))-methyltransferase n=1 Tax=Metamycoplasma spumans TaxID=92406 RepID=UPI000485BD44